jgi:hypothetical protein
MPRKLDDIRNEARAKAEAEEFCTIRESGDTMLMDAVTHFDSWQALAEFYHIDLELWEPKDITTNAWQCGRKVKGSDAGWSVQPLLQIKVRFVKRKDVARAKALIEDLIEDAKAGFPPVERGKPVHAKGGRKPKAQREKVTLEISLPDPHYGLLAWGEEAGQDWDSKLCAKAYLGAVQDLLAKSGGYDVGRVLFVTGNDFFNVNSKENVTSHGTAQDEDGRYRKTFKEGRQMLAQAIDTCRELAPVDVIVVPGNHDEERAFYLGDALECLYQGDRFVRVDNSPAEHKIVQIERALLGLTHGDKARVASLPLLMATQWKKLWAATEFHAWHLGHLHTEKKTSFSPSAVNDGVHVRWLPSLCPSSSWAAGKAFIPYRQGIGILWGQRGPVGEVIHMP